MDRHNWGKIASFFIALSLLLFISPFIGQASRGPDTTFETPVDPPTTGFEDRGGNGWTTHAEELSFLKEVSEESERMSYSVIGTSVEGRPLHLVRIGYPSPPSDKDIAKGRNILIMGTPHGNEPAGREMALQLLRDLAFTDDPELLDLLSEATVLFIPSQNPDGSEANKRLTFEGVDLNQDRLNLETPEARAIAGVINQFNPDILVSSHEKISSNPEISMLWPTNLNVDEQLRALNKEMVKDYVWPDVEKAGFSTGRYNGIGDEWNLRNMAGLQHSLAMLHETGKGLIPKDRVEMQMESSKSVLGFYYERFDEVGSVVTGAAERMENVGKDRSEPFYLDGAVNSYPSDSSVLNPLPCGYLLHTSQAKKTSQHIESFSLEIEKVSEHGILVPMAQPMMTVVPLLFDERAKHNEVNGMALNDCSNPGSLNPPAPPESSRYETDFSEYEVGSSPYDWSPLWRESNWTILDEPRRLEHRSVGDQLTRRALTWDKVGNIYGDVAVSAVVRASDTGLSKFQLGFHMSGNADSSRSRNVYYLEVFGSTSHAIRINRIMNGRFLNLGTAELPFTFEENTWYQIVVQREDHKIRAKVWPYGVDEPDEWQVMAKDRFIDQGRVGLIHLTDGVINEWAFFGVGTGGEHAPRAPEGLFEVLSAADIIESVEQFEEDGAFANHGVARSLQVHLKAVDHFEKKENADKVIKHMEGFKRLLDHYKDTEMISEQAYNALYSDAESLILKWQ